MARKILFLSFCWVVALGFAPAVAQTIYVSPTGNDANPGTQAQPKLTLQAAANAVQAGGTVQVAPGTYTRGFGQIGKSFSVQGAINPGDPKPVISRSTLNGSGDLIYLKDCPNVSIRGLKLNVDRTATLNGIYALGNMNNLVLTDLEITAMASDSDNIYTVPGEYSQGIAIDGGPSPTSPNVVISNVTITPTITGFIGSTFYFNRGILLRSASGTIGGASIASACTITAERDILTQFIRGGVTIQNVQFKGGGLDITYPETTASINILNNAFTVDNRANFLLQEIVLLKQNPNGAPITFQNNTISGHTNVGLRSAGVSNAIVRNNIFIPNDSALNYRHIEVNTLWEGTTQQPIASNSIQIVGNQFREATRAVGGVAISLKNERKGAVSPNPDFSNIAIGGAATDANVFDQRIRKYVTMDARPGRTFTLDLNLSQNQYKISGTPQLPAAMTQVNLLDLEDKFDHYIDCDSVGLIRVKDNELYVTPRSFIRPFTPNASIQRAIARSSANDIINIRDSIYQNPVTIDKALVFSMPGPLTSIESMSMQTPSSAEQLTIYQKLTVRGALALQTGKIRIGRNDLVMETPTAGNPATPSPQSYVVTDSAGHLVYNGLANTPLAYAIGTDTAFRPTVLENAGAVDNVGLRIRPDVLTLATSGPPVDTVVGFTWFAEEATAGGGNYNFTAQWFQVDEKPEFDRQQASVQRFRNGAWTSYERSTRAAAGTNPYTLTQDTIREVLNDLPLRVFSPQQPKDTIFYVDGIDGQDNAPLFNGRSPIQPWKTIQYAVRTATRVAPSKNIYIRVKNIGRPYVESISIPSGQSRMFIRGGYFGTDANVDVTLPAGGNLLLQANADSLYLDKFNFNITAASTGANGISLDSNCRYAVFDSLRINSAQGTAAGSGINSLLLPAGGTRRLFLTTTNIGPAGAGNGFARGISGSSLSGVIGGQRALLANGITAPAVFDLTYLSGDSLTVMRNTLTGDLSIKGSTGNLFCKGNIITGSSHIEGFAGATSTVRVDSNTISDYGAVALYSANNRTAIIHRNRFGTGGTGSPSIHLNSEFSAPIPAGLQYVAQAATVTANSFDHTSGGAARQISILLSNEGVGQINPAFGNIVIGGQGALANTFDGAALKYIRLNPNFPFNFPVDARFNLYTVNGNLKTPLAMAQDELFLLENLIDHTVDFSPLGFVKVRDQKTYVTQTSFLTGFTTRPAIQRAVNPAADGDEVNIEDFVYADSVLVNKSLTFNQSGNTTTSDQLTMDGAGATLTLIRNYTLTRNLILNNGRVLLNTNDLILTETAATIQGGNAGSYVITPNIGTLVQRGIGPGAKADSIPFTIGTQNSYLPLSLRNTGVVDDFRLRVFPDNLSNGLSGVPEDSVVSATWVASEAVQGGSILSVTPQWNSANEKIGFDRNRCVVQGYFGGGWNFFNSLALKQAQGSDPYWVTEPRVDSLPLANLPFRVYSYLPANILFIPNLFSPNNDGRNDRLLLYSQSLGPNITFKVFNRYGNVLFESSDAQKLLTEGWDGTVDGKPVNSGTYVWTLTGSFLDGRPLQANGKNNGYITIIR